MATDDVISSTRVFRFLTAVNERRGTKNKNKKNPASHLCFVLLNSLSDWLKAHTQHEQLCTPPVPFFIIYFLVPSKNDCVAADSEFQMTRKKLITLKQIVKNNKRIVRYFCTKSTATCTFFFHSLNRESLTTKCI